MEYRLKTLVKFPCAYCYKPFKSPQQRQRHEKIHDPKYVEKIQRRKCPKSVEIKIHFEENEKIQEKFVCSTCGKYFKTSELLLHHENRHKKLFKNLECKFCEMKFNSAANRLIHERIHLNHRQYKCSFCPRTFIQYCHRQNHERLHTGERPYKCSFCEKGFVQLVHKMHHERLGKCKLTGGRPFKCSLCEREFTQWHHRDRHERAGKCKRKLDDIDRVEESENSIDNQSS